MKRYENGVYLIDGKNFISEEDFLRNHPDFTKEEQTAALRGGMARSILSAHNQSGDDSLLQLKVDMLISDDPTYVSILQTAKASGLDHFPIPYVLSNCHNSLHAIGGTINCDDHVFGWSACRKYGGIYIPPHVAVMHQYMREAMAGGGQLALGSDSHTRYGALGTLGFGEGGGEVVKLLLGGTYDVSMPETVAVYLEGRPRPGVGPQDVALALIREVYPDGFAKNRILEFVGPGILGLSADFRNGVDVMTAETACWTSIWETDGEIERYLGLHERKEAYRELHPAKITRYDRGLRIDLGEIHPMIALPFHPSNAWEIREFQQNAEDLLREVEREAMEKEGTLGKELKLTEKLKKGKLQVDQAIISGCGGGLYSNIMAAADILQNASWDSGRLPFSIYPASQPILMELMQNGTAARLMKQGVILKTAFCGPCIGAGDIPAHGDFSIRHVTRNFLNREGVRPENHQIAAVALMDARSIAATVANGGLLTSAEDIIGDWKEPEYHFDASIYERHLQCFFECRQPEEKLIYGPNIKDWPEMEPLKNHLLLQVCGEILDEVTTTDDLCPSGETNSYRANPERLASFTLAGRDPGYVGRTKKTKLLKEAAERSEGGLPQELTAVWEQIRKLEGQEGILNLSELQIGSLLYAKRPGDGSSREMAASNQRVLGGLANLCREYATRRYRTNLINWGMLPLQMEADSEFEIGDWIYISHTYGCLENPEQPFKAWVIGKGIRELKLFMLPMTEEEKNILRAGSLINYNRKMMTAKK